MYTPIAWRWKIRRFHLPVYVITDCITIWPRKPEDDWILILNSITPPPPPPSAFLPKMRKAYLIFKLRRHNCVTFTPHECLIALIFINNPAKVFRRLLYNSPKSTWKKLDKNDNLENILYERSPLYKPVSLVTWGKIGKTIKSVISFHVCVCMAIVRV